MRVQKQDVRSKRGHEVEPDARRHKKPVGVWLSFSNQRLNIQSDINKIESCGKIPSSLGPTI